MLRLRNLKLRAKLISGFLLLLVLLGIPLVTSLFGLRQIGDQLSDTISTRTEALQKSARLHRNVFELRTQEKALLLTDGPQELSDVLDRIDSVRTEANERLAELGTLGESAEVKELFLDFKQDFRRYLGVLEKISDLVDSGKVQQAITLSRTNGKALADSVVATAMEYSDLQEQKLAVEQSSANSVVSQMLGLSSILFMLAIALGVFLAWAIGSSVAKGVGQVIGFTESIAGGDLETDVSLDREDELGQLAKAVSSMQVSLREARDAARDDDWLKSGVVKINDLMLGQDDMEALANSVITEMAEYLNARVGALYVATEGEKPAFNLLGTYAYTRRKHLSSRFAAGEGLVGQAALERKQILIEEVPDDYIRVVSGLGETVPRNICVTPFIFEGRVRGVIELATLHPLTELERSYIQEAASSLATAFEMVHNQTLLARQQEELKASNEELQAQTRELERSQEELKTQQQELENSNVELETQMLRVRESEERLKAQQEELEVTNEELKSKNELLERQKTEIETARENLAGQAEELALASKYKSEFLANMSHELRTPLNSLLLLAGDLRNNAEGNLSDDQQESASIIYDSGSDLLNLINEILDLSKIEAGRMELRLESLELDDLSQTIRSQFSHMAENQGLGFEIKHDDALPDSIITDPQRIGQVIKNLVGNALKFTEHGSVTVHFAQPLADTDLSRSGLDPEHALAIHVIDTGIGIPEDKQKAIFEAFQQADSGDRRRYGGTGLGLSISRELVKLLGGEIQLMSEPGKGSTFTIYVPFEKVITEKRTPIKTVSQAPKSLFVPSPAPVEAPKPRPASSIKDDRDAMDDSDHSVLIIEDDERFAGILAGHVKKRGFKVLVALTGEEGLELARSFRPDGVVLDLHLPQMDGWDVLSNLKQDVDTRHIPVHIVSAESPSAAGMRVGAIGHASKPLTQDDIDDVLEKLEKANAEADKLVLVVEDDPTIRRETVRIIGNGNVKVHEVDTGGKALDALRERRYDLVVLDLGLPDMPGLELLEKVSAEKVKMPPVIIYTVRELTQDEELTLRHYADSIILKDVRSQERLIDEVALFLHRVVGDLPEEKKKAIKHLHQSDEPLRGKKVLIVEDDMRTMFAMSRLLAGHGINPLRAENGEKALAMLDSNPDVDLVLMDMMMPVMDGYTASTEIRKQQRFANLPVIALTAKAMREDRQKCLDAGASDYLTKPVDQERLISLMRVWLSR